MGRRKTAGVIITFAFDAAFISVRYISEANWKFPPWGHRRTLLVVLAWAGCGFPTGAQDVNRADRLPVILQEMRGVVILWKEGCVCVCVCVLAPARSRHGFFRRVRCIRIIWRADRYVVKWCGCMRAEMCVHTLTQRVTLVQWKWKWEVWEKKRGSEEIEEFISTKRTSQQNNVYIACFQGCDSFCLLRENVSLESNGASPSLSTNMCVSLCLCVFSWSSSDTCWSQSGWSINSARVFCACE